MNLLIWMIVIVMSPVSLAMADGAPANAITVTAFEDSPDVVWLERLNAARVNYNPPLFVPKTQQSVQCTYRGPDHAYQCEVSLTLGGEPKSANARQGRYLPVKAEEECQLNSSAQDSPLAQVVLKTAELTRAAKSFTFQQPDDEVCHFVIKAFGTESQMRGFESGWQSRARFHDLVRSPLSLSITHVVTLGSTLTETLANRFGISSGDTFDSEELSFILGYASGVTPTIETWLQSASIAERSAFQVRARRELFQIGSGGRSVYSPSEVGERRVVGLSTVKVAL